MIYVDIVFRTKLGKWIKETKEFSDKNSALRFMYAMRTEGHIVDSWRCDDYMDNEWLGRRFKL